jgi:hypothetical protein
MDIMTEDELIHRPSMYVVELEREDVMKLVHAAHMHAEGLSALDSKRLMDSANRLSEQVVYYG